VGFYSKSVKCQFWDEGSGKEAVARGLVKMRDACPRSAFPTPEKLWDVKDFLEAVAVGPRARLLDFKGRSSVKVPGMTPAKRSRARAHKSSEYESPDEFEFSNLRAGPSGSRRSSNEVIGLVRPAPIARGTTAEAGKMTQRHCILTILGKAPPPPKPMVRG
jgi:hypothetical protein